MPSTIYKKIGTTITLSCPYVSVQHPTKWLGPPRLTTYAYKTSVKESLPHYERLKVTGDHSAGEYNLEIWNFSNTDAGLYRCLSINRNNPIQGDVRVHAYSKYLITNTLHTMSINVREYEGAINKKGQSRENGNTGYTRRKKNNKYTLENTEGAIKKRKIQRN